jgi:hypothetical protein
MNTGGGKTLVGLLIAQSLVNETGKGVLYVCPTNQLVEQAATRASECGLDVATYMVQNWTCRDVFDGSVGPCLTNYAAVFNGRSIFNRMDLGGIVFDDAHVAGSVIRGQFTLSFPAGGSVFDKITKKLQPYFVASRQGQSFGEVLQGDPRPLLYLPMFEVRRLAGELTRLLVDEGVDTERRTKFAWEHLKDHIERCVILVSGSRVEISPAALPLHQLRCLGKSVRRVYLTATLPSPAEFIKTFGVADHVRIVPKGKSGEAQRLFLLPSGVDNEQQRSSTKELVASRKACIIVPATKAAEEWNDVATLFDGRTGQAGIERFAAARGNNKLTLAARYDGIDLPGDACRVLVIDGLPKGSHLMTRFLDESLQVQSLRASHMAVRMVQAIGRIFRSNTDHGAVVLCGVEVQAWAMSPANQSYLPPLLQKQLQFGVSLRASVIAGETSYDDLISAVLAGDRAWDEFYRSGIDGFEAGTAASPPSWLVTYAAREQAAHQLLWEGNFQGAAEQFKSLADDADSQDAHYGAWFRHWEGYTYDLIGNHSQALVSYTDAANARGELGRPKLDSRSAFVSTTVEAPSPQAKAVASEAMKRKAKVFSTVDKVIADLKYGTANDPSGPAEESLRTLGSLLGLVATRPDNEDGTGPDVKWRHPWSKSGVALEAKTNKAETSQYQKKDDIGQFHDHTNYLREAHPGETYRKVIVGRWLQVSSDCHPPDDLLIVPVESFHDLADRVRQLYQFVLGPDSGETPEAVAERWLSVLGLKWPACIDNLPSKLAVDLQNNTPDGQAAE